MSDPHLLSPELVKPGKAIDDYDRNDMRMVKQSDEIVRAMVIEIKAMKPRLLIVTGDLTNNGERMSHQRMLHYLDRLNAAGIKTLVIPGNHDINNPYARSFDGDMIHDAESVSPQQFAQLYRNYGYGATSRLDTASLSYVCEPIPGLVVVGIDSNRYDDNRLKDEGDGAKVYHNDGRVKPETVQWVVEQVQSSRTQGKQVIVIMHHHLLEHFDKEASLLPNYVVAHAGSLRNQLLDAGVHAVFTGHLHVSDIARDYMGGDSITEMATGSAITYPFHYRSIAVDKGIMSISTHSLRATLSNEQLLAQGKAKAEQCAPAFMEMMARGTWKKLQGQLGKMSDMLSLFGGSSAKMPSSLESFIVNLHEQCDDAAQKSFIAILEGNESGNKESNEILLKMEDGMKSLFHSVFPDGPGNTVQDFMQESVLPAFDDLLRSILQDRNHCGTEQEVVVDDLNVDIRL